MEGRGEHVEQSFADVLAERRREILWCWRDRVRSAEPSLAKLDEPQLIDTMPELLEHLEAALRRSATEVSTRKLKKLTDVAREHAEHRYRAVTDIDAVIRELGILRGVIFDELERVGLRPDLDELRTLDEVVTNSLAESVAYLSALREGELKQARRLLESIMDNAPVAIYGKDTEGRYIFVNAQFEALSGFPRAQIVGLKDEDIFPADVVAVFRENDVMVCEVKEPMEAEETLPVGGETRTFLSLKFPLLDERDEVVGVCGVSTDITSRKHNERSLRESGERVRTLAAISRALAEARADEADVLRVAARELGERVADLCVLRVLGAEGTTLRMAAVHLRERHTALGSIAPDGLDEGWLEPMPLADSPWDEVIRTRRPKAHLRLTEDARRAHVEAAPPALRRLLEDAPLKSVIHVPLIARGRLLGVAALARLGASAPFVDDDVTLAGELTERVALAVENAALVTALQEAVRVREEVVGIVSHDLRSPLMAITMTSQWLLQRPNLDERLAQGLARVFSSANRASRLIRDLLDFAAVRTGQISIVPADADLSELTYKMIEEVLNAFPERKPPEVLARGDVVGRWDADRLSQVVANLLVNAFQHSPVECPVRVHIEGSEEEVQLTVQNEGEPIPEDLVPRLFEPFQGSSARRGQGNVGLGLYIAARIVEAHGGRIRVRSDREHGTSFTLHLPRRVPEQA